MHENGAGPNGIARCVSRDFSVSYDHLARRRVQDGWEDCFVWWHIVLRLWNLLAWLTDRDLVVAVLTAR